MKLIRYIQINLWRTFSSSTFWYCVLATFVLCFTAGVARDPKTNESLMAIQVLFRSEMLMTQTELNAWSIFCSAGGIWLAMFIPILSAFPFVPVIINNRITQAARFTISRIGKRRYQIGNISGTFLSGGLAIAIGYALFGIAVWLLFPSLHDYPQQAIASYLEIQSYGKPQWYANAMMQQQFVLPIAYQLFQMFLYSGCSSLIALVFASFVKNPYVVLCMPFFLNYGWTQINMRLSAMAYADFKHINQSLGRFASLTNPRGLLMLLQYADDTPWLLLIHFSFDLLLCVAFYFIMNSRVDCGE